ncbi:hypothetical protein COLO4_22639 [Corchorus olitorius]|uniref:Uncharacterized protein n=1 Tax=Corchorus olitorius TaxID=93759 RepID=A0A1R3IKU1_9ROSI|nr:hypothetical protein COLO4_22639 [Corchorus olitorius]
MATYNKCFKIVCRRAFESEWNVAGLAAVSVPCRH